MSAAAPRADSRRLYGPRLQALWIILVAVATAYWVHVGVADQDARNHVRHRALVEFEVLARNQGALLQRMRVGPWRDWTVLFGRLRPEIASSPAGPIVTMKPADLGLEEADH